MHERRELKSVVDSDSKSARCSIAQVERRAARGVGGQRSAINTPTFFRPLSSHDSRRLQAWSQDGVRFDSEQDTKRRRQWKQETKNEQSSTLLGRPQRLGGAQEPQSGTAMTPGDR